jgi:putative protease
MNLGDEIEVFGPYTDFFSQKIEVMLDEENQPIDSAPHPQQIVRSG